ncbi:MAG TPA: hypothetical protein QF753_04525 [Victivallales bacterium]|nr:hypothetical protein [Victivallales bacterium]
MNKTCFKCMDSKDITRRKCIKENRILICLNKVELVKSDCAEFCNRFKTR